MTNPGKNGAPIDCVYQAVPGILTLCVVVAAFWILSRANDPGFRHENMRSMEGL